MIWFFIAATIVWLGDVVSGLLFYSMFVILIAAFTRMFYGSSPMGWSLSQMSEPWVRPFRRLLQPVTGRSIGRFDPAPFLAAAVYFAGQLAAHMMSASLAYPFLVRVNRRPDPGLQRLAEIVEVGIGLYLFVVVLRVLVTYFGNPQHRPFVRFLSRWVDPVLYHVRKLVGGRFRTVDFAPLILMAALWFVMRVVLPTMTYAI